jgi:hypothetical protein
MTLFADAAMAAAEDGDGGAAAESNEQARVYRASVARLEQVLCGMS